MPNALLRPESAEAAIRDRIQELSPLLRGILQACFPTPLVSIYIPANAPATDRQMAC